MKRKLTILGLCVLAVLLMVLAFSSKKSRGQPAPAAYTPVVTQDGKLTFMPNSAWQATMTVTMGKPNASTNTSPSATETPK